MLVWLIRCESALRDHVRAVQLQVPAAATQLPSPFLPALLSALSE